MSDQGVPETMDARVARLEEQVQALLQVVADQAATIEAHERRAMAPSPDHGVVRSEPLPDERSADRDAAGEGPERTMGRRRLLLGGASAAAAAAATAAAVAGSATPAAAADGSTMIVGQNNTATSETKLSYGGSGTNGFRVEGGSSLALVEAQQSGAAAGVKGVNTSTGSGVEGIAGSGDGVYGESSGYGVHGSTTSDTGQGVRGVAGGNGFGAVGLSFGTSGSGIFAQGGSNGLVAVGTGASSTGVLAQSSNVGLYALGADDGTAVQAVANGAGTGVDVYSISGIGTVTTGAKAHLHLPVLDGRAAPASDAIAHSVGEVVVDGTGAVWLCITDGTPGVWRKIGGPATAGAFHVLPTPVRVYDSRPGTNPSQGPKTPLSGNVARAIDCTFNNSKVPVGATAVSLTVLLVNATQSNGNLTIWANGATRPSANTAVWGTGSGRYTTTAICALDAAAKIQASASNTTDLVLDVVGYYR